MSAGTLSQKKRARIGGQQLGDLISIGPAMLRDFELLRIRSVAQLALQSPENLYAKLNRLTGQRQDPCVLDTFCAAVEQAKNPRLTAEEGEGGDWGRKRKTGKKGRHRETQ